MRKVSILLSIIILAAMILAACGGEETATNLPSTNVPPVTIEVTPTSVVGSDTPAESSTPVASSTETTTTGTPGIPVTGTTNADRLSNELKFTVLDQSGKQVGNVDDMVLDLSKAKVLYVVVNAGGKKIPVPWALLDTGPASASSYPNDQQKTFTLKTDTDTLQKAPALDPKNVPGLGQAPDSWDIAFRKYWAGGGATSSTNTPSPAGTAATDITATATTTSNSAGTGTGNATSTPAASAGTTQGTGTGQGATTIQGVQLASQVLGAKITVGVEALAPGTSNPSAAGAGTGSATSTPSSAATSAATATSNTGTGLATSTPSSAATSVATATSSTGTSQTQSTPSAGATAANLSATINDMIVNNDAGEIMYIVIKTSFDDGEHLIPVPLRLLQLMSSGPASDTGEPTDQSFVLNIDATTLQNAPFFKSDQFPDLTMPGWNSEFDSFWQNNGSGPGPGTQATATP